VAEGTGRSRRQGRSDVRIETDKVTAENEAPVAARESFVVAGGTPERVELTASSGSQAVHNHCPACRIRAHSEPQAKPGSINVRPGTLDGGSWVKPVAQIWTRSAQPWAPIPGVPEYES
jgi:hypothetical protein